MNMTLEDFYKYVECLTDDVERQLLVKQDDETERLLYRLKSLLKGSYIRTFINGLSEHKIIIQACRKIEEMDNLLDELYIKHLDLPYPEEYFMKKQRKEDRVQRLTLMILLLRLFGYEWVLD